MPIFTLYRGGEDMVSLHSKRHNTKNYSRLFIMIFACETMRSHSVLIGRRRKQEGGKGGPDLRMERASDESIDDRSQTWK